MEEFIINAIMLGLGFIGIFLIMIVGSLIVEDVIKILDKMPFIILI